MERTLIELGSRNILLLENFLPEALLEDFARHIQLVRPSFHLSSRTLNDPEYTRSTTSDDLGRFRSLFEDVVSSALPEIATALGLNAFEPLSIQMRLTAIATGGYRKPRCDKLHQDPEAILSLVYVLGPSMPFEGGDLRFFETNPFAAAETKVRRSVDVALIPNAMVIFPSTMFYAMGEITPDRWLREGECLILDGVVI